MIVSHNFEMLKPGTQLPDPVVVRRFERVCEFLARHPELFTVGPFPHLQPNVIPTAVERRPSVGIGVTLGRHAEQLTRGAEQRIRRYL